MSPPPINIDGNDITGATIDDQEVQEITVDGDVVFSSGTKGFILDDYADNKLTNRNDFGTTNLDLTPPANSQFSTNTRPEYTTIKGSPSISSGVLRIPAGSGQNFPGFDHGLRINQVLSGDFTWEIKMRTGDASISPSFQGYFWFIFDSTNNEGWYIRDGDSDNFGYYDVEENNLFEIGRGDGITENFKTFRIERRNGNEWELFENGNSIFTTTENYMPPSPDSIQFTNARTDFQEYDDLRVF
jgi:hypothetical protein